MRIFISTGSRNVGVLYHKTGLKSLYDILKTGKLRLSYAALAVDENAHGRNRNFFSSFTRSKSSPFLGDTFNANTYVIIAVDGTKLSSSHKIVPVNYFANQKHGETISERENEERLISNLAFVDILPFIVSVSFIRTRKQNYNNAGLLQTVAALKKRGIDFAFYSSYAAWIRKDSMSIPQELPVFTPVKLKRSDKSDYKALLALRALLTKLPEEWNAALLKFAKKLGSTNGANSTWGALVAHPASYMNSYVNHAQLNQKLFRILKRFDITDALKLRDYVRAQLKILKGKSK